MVVRHTLSPTLQSPMTDGGIPRADILDRNGNVLATHLVTASVYIDTRDVQNVKETVRLLGTVFKKIPESELRRKVLSGKSFIWLARHITPKKQEAVQRLGLPGVYFKKDYKRVYPFGPLASHVIGFCDPDGAGLTGIENAFDTHLFSATKPLKLSIDIKVQHILRETLDAAMQEFHAIGANAIIMDIHTGEIIGMESLPSVDLNYAHNATPDDLFNRNTLGVYEMGSVFKILNTAIALESGRVSLNSIFDARAPIKIGKFTVTDFCVKQHILTLEEAFIFSSNIASVKISQQFGGAVVQKKFFNDFGIFEPVKLEISEMGLPIVPARWTETTSVSATYGYGVAISPLRLLCTVGGIVNGGVLVNPTLLCGKEPTGRKILSQQTSQKVRTLMRKVICKGTAKRANVKGYQIFGKTGTANKNKKKGYDKTSRRTIFVGGFPASAPRYIFCFMLDEPKPTKDTFGFASAGWNVAPYGGKAIARIAPLLGVPFSEDEDWEFDVEIKDKPEGQPVIQKTKQFLTVQKMLDSGQFSVG
ncbi:peptidoglycan glycosyltransferase [Alphaproteobacteria bacterium]|nr:peptidoglycan glycosyltransferase [Alphaproteobacteria bacterium]GHS97595.1 peptidoglycan glycosyltransferase [Alphaproteobacteria bacterium]